MAKQPTSTNPPGLNTTVVANFDEIQSPGAYVSQNGMLFRVPDEGLQAGHSPRINVVSNEMGSLTKISNDPWLPISKARELASNADLAVNF